MAYTVKESPVVILGLAIFTGSWSIAVFLGLGGGLNLFGMPSNKILLSPGLMVSAVICTLIFGMLTYRLINLQNRCEIREGVLTIRSFHWKAKPLSLPMSDIERVELFMKDVAEGAIPCIRIYVRPELVTTDLANSEFFFPQANCYEWVTAESRRKTKVIYNAIHAGLRERAFYIGA